MDTKEVASELVALCNAGRNADAVERLYAHDIVSIETNEPMKETRGIDGVRGKNQWWVENHEVHSGVTRGPWVNGDQFITENTYDITFKPNGKRSTMNETAVYTVRDGKIVHEAFFNPLS